MARYSYRRGESKRQMFGGGGVVSRMRLLAAPLNGRKD